MEGPALNANLNQVAIETIEIAHGVSSAPENGRGVQRMTASSWTSSSRTTCCILELANLADRPALDVACSFDPPLVDALGRDVSELRVFRRVEFLGPGRRVRTLLDSVPGYFDAGRPGASPSPSSTSGRGRPAARRRSYTTSSSTASWPTASEA